MRCTLSQIEAGGSARQPRVLWIHCSFWPARFERCASLAENFLSRAGLFGGATYICVDNAVAASAPRVGWIHLRGSNDAREFSAWSEGWRHACSIGVSFDMVVLSNDTFPFHQPFAGFLAPLFRWKLRRLLRSGECSWALGVVERGFEYRHLSEYITSFMVILGPQAVQPALTQMTTLPVDCGLESDWSRGRVIWSDDPWYQDEMNRWLTRPGRRGWYAAQHLAPHTFSGLRAKAQCMLLEHALSRRLVGSGVRLVSCFDLPPPLGRTARVLYRLWELHDRRRRSRRADGTAARVPTT